MIDIIKGKSVPSVVHTNTRVMRAKDLAKLDEEAMEGSR
jgi:hypothetical protein